MTRRELGGPRPRWLRPASVLACCLAVALAALAASAWAAKDDLDLASRASGAVGAKGNDDSFTSAISADGRFVAFDSAATNLHPDDAGARPSFDVFVRDLQANTTTLVSRATGATGVKGNGSRACRRSRLTVASSPS